MKKSGIIFILILGFLMFSCGQSSPDQENEYIPTIIYRVESTTHTSCQVIEYTNENGVLISLTNEDLPWEYEMNADDNAYVSLHATHDQDPDQTGTADPASGSYLLIDTSADFIGMDDTQTILYLDPDPGDPDILHQISTVINSTTLKLNLDTFVGGEAYEIYNRMYYMIGIYRIDETGREDPLIYTEKLYADMDTTIESYAYKY